MRTLRLSVAVTALLMTTAKADSCAGDDAAEASPISIQVVEIDDLVLPEALTTKFAPDQVPKAIRELDGRRVRIHGYVIPTPTSNPVSAVVVSGETHGGIYRGVFTGSPADRIVVVRLRTPRAFLPEECVTVDGVFRVRPILRDSRLRFLFSLEDASATSSTPRNGYHNSVRWEC